MKAAPKQQNPVPELPDWMMSGGGRELTSDDMENIGGSIYTGPSSPIWNTPDASGFRMPDSAFADRNRDTGAGGVIPQGTNPFSSTPVGLAPAINPDNRFNADPRKGGDPNDPWRQTMVPWAAPENAFRDEKGRVRYGDDPRWYERAVRAGVGFLRGPDLGGRARNIAGRTVATGLGVGLPYSVGGAVQGATSNDPVYRTWNPEEDDPNAPGNIRRPPPERQALLETMTDPRQISRPEDSGMGPENGGYVPPSQRGAPPEAPSAGPNYNPSSTPTTGPSASSSPLPTVPSGRPPVGVGAGDPNPVAPQGAPPSTTPPATNPNPRDPNVTSQTPASPGTNSLWWQEEGARRDMNQDGFIGNPENKVPALPTAAQTGVPPGANTPFIQGQYQYPAVNTQEGVAAINALYQKYYGRPATQDEIMSHRANPGGYLGIEAALKADTKNHIPGALGPAPGTGTGTVAAQTGAGAGGGGYSYLGFDFGQDPANRDITKSAKYAFSHFAGQAAAKGVPQPRSKEEAQAWFLANIAPGMTANGFQVHKVVGDKAFISTREFPKGQWVDFQGNSGGQGDQPLTWQAENYGAGMDADAEALFAVTGGGGGGDDSYGMSMGSGGDNAGVLDSGNPALNSFAQRLINQLLEGAALDDVLEREQRTNRGLTPAALAAVGF